MVRNSQLQVACASFAIVALLAPAFAAEVLTIAGTGVAGFSGDGGPATKAQLDNPYGLSRGPDGALYICDMGNHRVRKIDKAGIISTVAGTGEAGCAGDGGPATAAKLNEPYEVRFDASGALYVVDMKANVIRKVDAKGIVSTVAGTGSAGFSGDGGPAVKAQLNQPHAIQLDPSGTFLYVCDIGNNRLRRVDVRSGIITTFAGDGTHGTTPDGAHADSSLILNGPRAVDFEAAGDLWLALREGNAIYRIDMKTLTVRHVAGTGRQGFTGNGGPAVGATLSGPKGIAAGRDGNVYFTDTESHTIRFIDTRRGTVELLAGTGRKGDGPDGDALHCAFSRPHGVFADPDGSVYVGDSENHCVRRITPPPGGH